MYRVLGLGCRRTARIFWKCETSGSWSIINQVSAPVLKRHYQSGSDRSKINVPYRGEGRGEPIDHNKLAGLDNARRQRLQEQFGELSADDRLLRSRILSGDVNATEHLQTTISDGTVNGQTIRVCLISAFDRLKRFPRKKRLELLKPGKDALAKTILSQLWQDETLWSFVISNDRDTRLALCFFAIWEGHEELMKQCLDARVTVEAPKYSGWRGWLFSDMVTAHLMLDSDHTATGALRLFFDVLDWKDKVKSQFRQELQTTEELDTPIVRLGIIPSVVALARELNTGTYEDTDAQLYSRFQTFYGQFKKAGLNPVQREYDLAALKLCHPNEPQAGAMLAFLKTHVQDLHTFDEMKSLLGKLFTRNSMVKKQLERAQVLLKLDGRAEEAHWVGEQVARLPLNVDKGHTLWKSLA